MLNLGEKKISVDGRVYIECEFCYWLVWYESFVGKRNFVGGDYFDLIIYIVGNR